MGHLPSLVLCLLLHSFVLFDSCFPWVVLVALALLPRVVLLVVRDCLGDLYLPRALALSVVLVTLVSQLPRLLLPFLSSALLESLLVCR